MKILILLTAILTFSAGAVFSQTDEQAWNETQIIFPLIKQKDGNGKQVEKLSIYVSSDLRVGRNFRHFVEERAGFGLNYRYNKYLSFTPSYQYVAEQPPTGNKRFESRFGLAAMIENHWKKFALDDRNVIEYRSKNSAPNSFRYRNRPRFIYPVKKDDKVLFSPFAAYEIYYDFRARSILRDEFSAGINRKLNPRFSADFYYLWLTNKTIFPRHANTFGLNLKIKIG